MTIFKHIAIATEEKYAFPQDSVFIPFKIESPLYAWIDFELDALTQHNELPKLVANLDSLTEMTNANLTDLINALTDPSFSKDDQIKNLTRVYVGLQNKDNLYEVYFSKLLEKGINLLEIYERLDETGKEHFLAKLKSNNPEKHND